MMKRVIHIRPHWCERVPSSQWMCHHRCMTYTPSLPSLSGSPTSSPSPTAPPALSPPNRPLPDRPSLNLPSPGQSPFPGPGTSPPAQSGRAQPQSQGSSKPSPHPGLPGLPIPSGTSPRLPTPPDASSPIDCVCVRAGEELALHVSDRSRVDQKLLASLSDCLSKAYAAEWTGSSGEFYRSEIHSLSSQTVSVQNAMMRTRRMVS